MNVNKFGAMAKRIRSLARLNSDRQFRWQPLKRRLAMCHWIGLILWTMGVSRGYCGDVSNALWAVRAGGRKDDVGRQIATDPAGNVVVAGHFVAGTISFGQTNLTASAAWNLFIAKYDPQGGLLWVRSIAASRTNLISSGLAVDPEGNIFLSAGTSGGGAVGQGQIVAKVDPAGGLLWTKSKPNVGSPLWPVGKSLALDGSGHIYMSGFGPDESNPYSNLIVIKMDAEGNELWRRISPMTSGGTVAPNGLAVDRDGNCAVTGWFYMNGSASLDFGSTVLNSVGYFDDFTAKYDSEGNVLWAASLGTESLDQGGGVALDQSGAVYVTGYSGGEVNAREDHFFWLFSRICG